MDKQVTKDERRAYLDTLVPLQNHPANATQDHMTITGFFKTHCEFVKHIAYLTKRARVLTCQKCGLEQAPVPGYERAGWRHCPCGHVATRADNGA